jgi:hypothetical protein
MAGGLCSAQRANRISTDNEEQAILRSLDENAERALRHLESVALMPQATTKIRDSYDAEWINRRVGEWLETFYNADIVAIFGIGGETEYFRSRVASKGVPADLAAELAPAIDILRGRIAGQPRGTVLVSPPDLSKPAKAVALFQNFLGQSAIVAAVAVGEEPNPANGNARAPVVALVKYVNHRLLAKIGAFASREPPPDRRGDGAQRRSGRYTGRQRGTTGGPPGVAAEAARRGGDRQLRTVCRGGACCLRAADPHHHAPYAADGRRNRRRRAAITPPRSARSGLRIAEPDLFFGAAGTGHRRSAQWRAKCRGVLHRSRPLQGRQRYARPPYRRRAHSQRHAAFK